MITNEDIIKQIIPTLKDQFLDDKTGQKLRTSLNELFCNSGQNPYALALDLIEKSPDFLQPRSNNLCGTIWREFAKWHNTLWTDANQKRKFLTMDLRKRAFHICSWRHTHLLPLAELLYHLSDIGELFLDDIESKISRGFFKDAIQCVIVLKLQDFFKLNDILIPCILQDKSNFVEAYIEDYPHLQKELLTILDAICLENADLETFLKSYNIKETRRDKLVLKPLQKLIARICKRFNTPLEWTPNFARTRSEGAMRFLLQRRYTDKAIEPETFEDMIVEAVKTCPYLDSYLLDLLCFIHTDLTEALKFAKVLDIPERKWPEMLVNFRQDNPGLFNGLKIEESAVISDEFLKLPFPVESVNIVNEVSQLYNAVETILKAEIIAIDTEWRINFGQTTEKVAIMQIALPDQVFLIDLLELPDKVEESRIRDAIKKIFCDEKLLKLGFHFGGDVRTLASTLPYCKDSFDEVKNLLCLGALVDNLKHQHLDFMRDTYTELIQDNTTPFKTNGCVDQEDSLENVCDDSSLASVCTQVEKTTNILPEKKQHSGLSEVCLYFLGKPLNKNEQISNWNRRPLRRNQIHYAALDAHCLLEIYEKVQKRAQDLDLNFDSAFKASLINGSSVLQSKLRIRKMAENRNMERDELLKLIQQIKQSEEQKVIDGYVENLALPKTVKDVKIVVDKMLNGLGKHLRRCGIDCKILDNSYLSNESIVKIGIQEKRLILSSGSAFHAIAQQLPSNMCMSIPNTLNSKEQLAYFIEKQNVQVSEADIFSRCLFCNTNEFLTMPSDIFRTIWDNKIAARNPLNPVPFDKEEALDRISGAFPMYLRCKNLNPVFNFEQFVLSFPRYSIDLLTGEISPLFPPPTSMLNKLNLDKCHTPSESELERKIFARVETLAGADNIFQRVAWFYVCATCGKVYWDGAHMKRYVENLGVPISKSGDLTNGARKL